MADKLSIFKCNVCGNIVELIHVGGGTLVCCEEDMQLLVENTTDAAKEKHVPVIEKSDAGVTIRVGSVPHPMADDHYIEWIQLLAGGKACRQFLNPGDEPVATFPIQADDVSAREFCNLHGLWKA
ncbi:MAG: desulfoferrodoxin [Planctomycetota bacterium]|nr:MAG: desulfoferrodoxin [Planctomycetota bacterium]